MACHRFSQTYSPTEHNHRPEAGLDQGIVAGIAVVFLCALIFAFLCDWFKICLLQFWNFFTHTAECIQ